MPEPRTITVTPRVAIAAAVFALLMLGLLAGQLTFIVEQRRLIAQQRDIATRQEDRAAPVLDTTRALIGSPADARRAARDVGGALRRLEGLMATIRRTRVVPITAEVLQAVRDEGLVRGVGRFVQAALQRDLVGEVTRAARRAPELVDAVQRSVDILQRTYPTLRASLRVQRSTHSLQSDAVRMQRESLAIQRQTLTLTQQLRDIAQQTLVHAASIDRKTGGAVPPVVP